MRQVVLLVAALAGVAGCGKGSTPTAEAAAKKSPEPAVAAASASAAPAVKPPAGPEPKLPESILQGIKLDADMRARFFALYDKLPSPCGKTQSLHAAVDSDPTCKRAPFAARWLARVLADSGLNDENMLAIYGQHYSGAPPQAFDLAGAAHTGDAKTAKVAFVEFFDYACSHCKMHEPIVAELVKKYGNDLVVYYMNFPLGHWPTSEAAARAAVAADRQGKFAAFHHALFESQEHQAEADVRKVAQAVGLDMKKFEADWKDPAVAALVKAQHDQGLKVHLESTPTIFINGREYMGAPDPTWLAEAIDEELAAVSK